MKHRISRMAAVVTVCVFLPITTGAASSPPASAAAADAPAEEIRVLGVDALIRDPKAYGGIVRVRGVVGSVFPKEQRLGLLDAAYLSCCPSPCGGLQALPVRWAGDMPKTQSLVLVTGEIRRSGEKLEFIASGLELIDPAGAAK